MTGLLLRLAGPLQSWGERSAFNAERDSAPFPTRSALTGMFSAAEGLGRDQDPARYRALEFTVRIDRPGVHLSDYHTVGGGQPDQYTAATSGGKHKGDAVITRRHYLADAVFVVAVTGPASDIARIAARLQYPYWAPYLGRRSCVPDEPFLLRAHVADPVGELLERAPLSLPGGRSRRPGPEQATVPVDFVWENYRGTLPEDAVALTLYDMPESFAPHGRSHGKRRLWRTREQLPAALAGDRATPLYQSLITYAEQQKEEPA